MSRHELEVDLEASITTDFVNAFGDHPGGCDSVLSEMDCIAAKPEQFNFLIKRLAAMKNPARVLGNISSIVAALPLEVACKNGCVGDNGEGITVRDIYKGVCFHCSGEVEWNNAKTTMQIVKDKMLGAAQLDGERAATLVIAGAKLPFEESAARAAGYAKLEASAKKRLENGNPAMIDALHAIRGHKWNPDLVARRKRARNDLLPELDAANAKRVKAEEECAALRSKLAALTK